MKPVKKSIRQTARKQMKRLRDEKKQGKAIQKAYDKAGGFVFEGQKKQAKKNLKAGIKRGKKAVRYIKRSLLKSNR